MTARHVVVIGGFAPSLVLFRAPLLSAMISAGHRVTALAADGTDEIRTSLARLGVEFEDLALQRAGRDPVSDAASLGRLVRRLRALRPDVVFAYTMKPVMYGLLAARLAGVRRRFAMITGLGYTFQGQEKVARRLLRFAVARGLRLSLSDAGRLFVQNPDDLAELRCAGALPNGLATTIVRGSGVDLEAFKPTPLPDGPLTFVYVGRLLREKGITEFVELARRLRSRPGVRFRAVGWVDPNPASVSRAEVDRWVSDGVLEYLGEVRDVRPVLADSHVLVLPSYREGTPRSVLEAMAMSRAVIVTNVPGSRETIVDGVEGLMVPVRDVDALVAAAERLIADRSRISELGRRGRQRAERLYDAHQIAASMVAEMELGL